MRAILPRPGSEVDLAAAYAVERPAGAQRPFVRATMISSIDGAVSVRGRSGPLGGGADRAVFAVLRSLADVILVGAGTVRAEGYGPVRLADEVRAARVRRKQCELPPIAVVTRSGSLDWDAAFFTAVTSPGARPIVYTTARAAAEIAGRAGAVAEVVAAGGTDRGRRTGGGDTGVGDSDGGTARGADPGAGPGHPGVDVGRVLEDLAARGHRSVLVEGGPELNAAIAAAGVLDELCLTVAPLLAGGGATGVLGGAPLDEPLRTSVVHLLEEDGFLFYRLALGGAQGTRS